MSTKPKKVNIIALTQAGNIDIFLQLKDCLKEQGMELGKVGALTSFAKHFERSDIVKSMAGDVQFIKEWDIVKKALATPYDPVALQKKEETLSPASVWNAIIGDRRLIYGRYAKFIQDYRVHFSDEQLWSIAYQFILAYEKMLDEVKPDVILGFTPVTFGELLGLEIAASRGIPTLQLHSSRVRNYFAFHDVVSGTSKHFLALIKENRFNAETKKMAREVYEEVTKKGLIYEGANKSIAKGRKFDLLNIIKTFPRAFAAEGLKMMNPVRRNDHHDPGALIPWFLLHIVQPLKEKYIAGRLKLSGRYLNLEDLQNIGEYCFFPLQSEPEVSLQVLGRPYHKNQIELMRNVAASLPAGMRLVVKEHPRSLSLRPYQWYKDVMKIPNLYFVDVHGNSNTIVHHSRFVAVISGTIGFEAVMMQKPVLILGHPKYEDISEKMTEKCYNLYELPEKIRTLLATYQFDEKAVITFLSALIVGSVDIDLYSNLLRKPGRYSFQDESVTPKQDLDKLAHYTIQRIEQAYQKR